MKKRIKLNKILMLIILMAISYITYVSCDIYFYGKIDEVRKVDSAIVLGAGIWDDEPCPVFEERLKHGIWLYKNNYVETLIFTGGYGDGEMYSEASVAMNYAILNSVSNTDIFIEEQSTITQENLLHAAKIVEDNNIEEVIIVSDPLHMKRAMLMAKDYGINAYSSPTPTTKYVSTKNKLTFLAREVFFYIGYQIYRLFN